MFNYVDFMEDFVKDFVNASDLKDLEKFGVEMKVVKNDSKIVYKVILVNWDAQSRYFIIDSNNTVIKEDSRNAFSRHHMSLQEFFDNNREVVNNGAIS